MDYFVLGISRGGGKTANQVWLLAEDADTVLHGGTFANYILKDEATNRPYPAASGIMFVSLSRLSGENSKAGELAAFLLGKAEPQDGDVKTVLKAFNSSFDALKQDKEAKNMISFAEKYINMGYVDGFEEGETIGEAKGEAIGKARGKAEGMSLGTSKMLELISGGLSPEEAWRKVNEDFNKNEGLSAESGQA